MVTAYFNGRENGSKATLNSLIRGEQSDRIVRNLPEFLREAGRDYSIMVVPSYQQIPAEDGGEPEFRAVPDQFNLVRSSDRHVVSPKTVSGQTDPISLMDIADSVGSMVDAGWATPDCVYEARDGSLEVLTLRLDADGMLGEEEFRYFACIVNPHGGSGKVQLKIVTFRPWCSNMFAAMVSQAYDLAVGHRKSRKAEVGTVTKERFDFAVQQWENLQEHIRRLSERVNVFSSMPLATRDAEELTDKLLGITKLEDASTQRKNDREFILANFDRKEIGTFGRNAWDWMNAVTHLTSNGRGGKKDPIDRIVGNLDPNGTGYKLEQKANGLLVALAA
jgi:hypothetical protein